MVYALWGFSPPVEGSKNSPISVAVSSTSLQESSISDRRTALVILLATFWLWRRFQLKAALLSINGMESGDIQRRRGGGGVQVGGDWFQVLEVLKLSVGPATFLSEGGV